MRSKQSWMPSRGADATLPDSAREASIPRPAGRRRRGSKRWLQALRLRRVLSMAGLMALSIGAIAFLLGVSWRASDAVFLSGVYGTTGSLMVISSLFHSATWNRRTAPVRLVRA